MQWSCSRDTYVYILLVINLPYVNDDLLRSHRLRFNIVAKESHEWVMFPKDKSVCSEAAVCRQAGPDDILGQASRSLAPMKSTYRK